MALDGDGDPPTSGPWQSINKYGMSVVLLLFSTIYIDAITIPIFLLFLVHTVAYYSFRSNLSFLINTAFDTSFDILLQVRNNKRNLRSFFAFFNLLVATLVFIVEFLGRMSMLADKEATINYLIHTHLTVRLSSNLLVP